MSARRALTATLVAAVKEGGVHWVAPSLYLQVRQEQGTRSWLFRYTRDGENQWMGIGSYADKTFTEARDEAAMLRVLVNREDYPADMWDRINAPSPLRPDRNRGRLPVGYRSRGWGN